MEKWEFMERWVGSFVSKALDTCKVTLGIPVGKEWDWGWGGESQGRTGFISLTWSCRSSDYYGESWHEKVLKSSDGQPLCPQH